VCLERVGDWLGDAAVQIAGECCSPCQNHSYLISLRIRCYIQSGLFVGGGVTAFDFPLREYC